MIPIASSLFDVAVIGNVGIDTNVYGSPEDVDFNVESNFTENIDCIGQAGGYTSRGYRRLAKATAFIGYLGDDHNGRHIRKMFTGEGIDTSAVFIDPAGTSRSINFMHPDGRRKNFYDGKSHMELHPNLETCRTILAASKLAHFHLPNWARELLPIAKGLGITIACDLQDIVNLHDPYRQDFIAAADILFFSAVNHTQPKELLKTFVQMHPQKIFIMGMGAEGCTLGMKDNIQSFSPIAMEMPVVDTNGAGDGLAVGFLTSYIFDRYTITDSIHRGQIAARYTCAQKANSSELITMDQLNYFFSTLTPNSSIEK